MSLRDDLFRNQQAPPLPRTRRQGDEPPVAPHTETKAPEKRRYRRVPLWESAEPAPGSILARDGSGLLSPAEPVQDQFTRTPTAADRADAVGNSKHEGTPENNSATDIFGGVQQPVDETNSATGQRESRTILKGIKNDSKGNQTAEETSAQPSQRESNGPLKGITVKEVNSITGMTGKVMPSKGNQTLGGEASYPPKGNQEGTDSLMETARFPLEGSLIPFPKGNQGRVDSLMGADRSPSQRESTTPSKGNQAKAPPTSLPSSPQQRAMLRLLALSQEETGLDHTARMRRIDLAQQLNSTTKTMKLQLQRLVRSGFIIPTEIKHGRWHGGNVYQVPKDIVRLALSESKGNQDASSKGIRQRESSARRSRSRSSTTSPPPTPTTNEAAATTNREIEYAIHAIIDGYGVGEKIGALELIQVWNEGGFPNKESFIQSVEHAAFKILNDRLNSPIGWMRNALRNAKGYLAAPKGFRPWREVAAERQQPPEADKAKDPPAQPPTTKLHPAQLQLLNEFCDWESQLSPDDRETIVHGRAHNGMIPGSLFGELATSMLVSHFAETHDATNLLDDAFHDTLTQRRMEELNK